MVTLKRLIVIPALLLVSLSMYCGSDPENPQLQVVPAELDFGLYRTADTVSISNVGGGTLDWHLVATRDWMTVSCTTGTCAGETDRVIVRVDRENLPEGIKQGQIVITSNDRDKTIGVSMEVRGPECSVSPEVLDFGEVCVGESAEKSFVITNTGVTSFSGDVREYCDEFSIVSGSGSFTLNRGESRTVRVKFSPTTPGPKSCVISAGSSACSDVSCSGVGDECPRDCEVDPTSLPCGEVCVGQSSAPQYFTITNNGTETVSGTVSESCDDFSIEEGMGSYTLEMDESITVAVIFEPTSAGEKTCTIETGCEPVIASGTGKLDCDDCLVSPTILPFDDVCVGEAKDLSFTIENIGATTLNGTVSESCDAFSVVSGGGPYSLSPGESHLVVVQFAPTSEEAKVCTIETGNSGCLDVSCTGDGVTASCSVTPAFLDFGNVCPGGTSSQSFEICNTSSTCELTGYVSESCADFSILSGGGAYVLGPGACRTVTVQFAPTSTGTKTCTIETGNSECSDVTCTGVLGDCSDCDVSPAELLFGDVCVGESENESFTITNSGNTTLSGYVSESNTQYSIVSGGGSYDLSPGASRTVTVQFKPTSTGTKTCTIETGDSECSDVPCRGEGVTASCSVTPASLDFGNVCPGGTSNRSFEICNTSGTCELTGYVSEGCSYFSITSGGGSYTLSPGACRTVTVQYAPTSLGTHSCTIDPGTCLNVTCNGTSQCQEAWIEFYDFEKSGDEILSAKVTTILPWNLNYLYLVELDVGDMKTASDCALSSSWTSLQIYQDQLIPAHDHNYIYPEYWGVDGLPIDGSCSSVDMYMRGRLEEVPELTEGFFCKTNRNGFSRRYSISTSCEGSSYNIDDYYIYSAPTGTRFYYWFVEPGNLKDGWISNMELTFNDWWISTADASQVQEGKIRIISAQDQHEFLPENQAAEVDKR